MQFLSHVCKKDLVRLKWVLACWLGILGIQSFLGIAGAKIAADDFVLQIIMPELAMLVSFLQGIMVIIIVPLLIQDDPVVGTTGFWFTRPIGRKDLFITKITLAVCVLVLLPLIAELFVFAANGFISKQLLLVIPEILLEKLAFMTPFVLLAVITPKFSRYAMVGGTILAVLIVFGILMVVSHLLLPRQYASILDKCLENAQASQNYTLGLSIGVVKKIFIIAAGIALIAYQYASRNTRKTVILGISGFVLMMALERIWGIDFLQTTAPKPADGAVASDVKFAIDANRVAVEDALRYRKDSDREKTVSAQVSISTPGRGEFAVLKDIYPEIDFGKTSKGKVSKLQSSYINSGKETFDSGKYMEALQAILPDEKIVNPFGQGQYKEIFACSETSLNSDKGRIGTYKADTKFDLYKYAIMATMPVSRGARAMFDSEQIVIFDVLERDTGISIIIGEKKVRLLFDRSVEKTDPRKVVTASFPRSIYVLVNKKRKEAFVPEVSDTSALAASELINANSRLYTQGERLDFVYVNNRSESVPKIDKEWLKDAELVRADAVRVGQVSKKVEIDGFTLPEKSTVTLPKRKEAIGQPIITEEDLRRAEKAPPEQKIVPDKGQHK